MPAMFDFTGALMPGLVPAIVSITALDALTRRNAYYS